MNEKKSTQLSTRELTTRGYAYGFYITIREGKTVIQGFDEVLHDAIQAVKDNEGKKLIKAIIENGLYEVFDNGIGMSATELHLYYSQFIASGWKKAKNGDSGNIGIRGIGRYIFAGVCGDFDSGSCYLEIMSSKGDGVYAKLTLKLTKNQELLEHPDLEELSNGELKDNGVNIINGVLKGTIVRLVNGKKFTPDDKTYTEFGMRFRKYVGSSMVSEKDAEKPIDELSFDNDKILLKINDRVIEPVDVTHDMQYSNKEDGIYYNFKDDEHYVTLIKTLKYYHKGNPSKKEELRVLCTCTLCSLESRNKYKWEREYEFNSLGGVFVEYNGCLLTVGGNAQDMFQQTIETGDSKTTKKFGDTSGSYSAYNRLTLQLNENHAELFGIRAAKSTGITPLASNTKLLTEYFVDENTCLYNAIGCVRSFIHQVYIQYIKRYITGKVAKAIRNGESPSVQTYDNAIEKIDSLYKDFDFSQGGFKTWNKRKFKEWDEEIERTDYLELNNPSLFIHASVKFESDGSYKIESLGLNYNNPNVDKYLSSCNDRDIAESILKKTFRDYLETCFVAGLTEAHIKKIIAAKGTRLSNGNHIPRC